jgi:hypothetical protein
MDPYPNRQPDVLPTISEEVPMFDLEIFQPLLEPLQAGSENDVSVQNNASSTAKPQHISYETPQPFPISDSPSASSEYGSGLPTPGGNLTLESLVEDPGSAGHRYTASPVRHSPNPRSSMSEPSIENSTLGKHAPVLPSTTTYQPSRLSTYGIFGGDVQESVSSPVMTTVSFPSDDDEFIFINREHESEPVLDQTGEKESTYEDPIKLLSYEIEIAKQSKEREERRQAEREYCSAINKYITNGGSQTEPLLRVAVMGLAQCLNYCPTYEVPSAACICLDLLESLIRAPSSTTVICLMILVALKTLFGEYRGIFRRLDLEQVIIALNDPGINLPILQALASFFETRQEDPTASESCENRGFRFGLLSFACVLRRLLEASKSHDDDFSILELRQITIYLRRTKSSFEGELSTLGLVVNKLYAIFNSFVVDTWYLKRYLRDEPVVTELASACTAAGWFHEAETLFATLRSSQSLELLGHPGDQRKIEISKQYCLYLKRRKCYAELLSELHDTYAHLANNYSMVSMSLTAHVADLTDLLNDIPLPYDQYVSSEKAREIGRLEILFSRPAEFSVRQISDINSAMSFDVNLHDLVLERNKSEAMDDDELMEDCKSSNQFGVTYTESGMTGISFNYSDLYR